MQYRYEQFAPTLGSSVPRRSSWLAVGRHRIHVEHVGAAEAPVRIMAIHGAGGNANAMWPFAAHLSTLGARVTVPDLPGYGMTEVGDPGAIRYQDWRDAVEAVIRAEADDRPLVLFGASLGGMLSYDAAAATGLVAAVAATCLLDPRSPQVRARLTPHPALARLAGPSMRVLAGPLARLRVPIRWVSDMRHIANDPGLVREVVADRRGGGTRVPLGWLRSYLESRPLREPEQFTTPTWLLQPGLDRWTPLELSLPFFSRIAGDKELVVLDGCGHFPIEQPGFTQMIDAVRRLTAKPGSVE